MDKVTENINTRRSIRKFEPVDIPDEDIIKMLKAAMQAPGSRMGAEPWEFIVVKDKETIQKLSKVDSNTKALATASVAIVSLANMDRVHYKTVWQQDMSAAVTTLLLQAANLGYGALWMGIAPTEERMDKIAEMFELKGDIHPFNLIAIGKPGEGYENKFVDKFDESRIHFEKY